MSALAIILARSGSKRIPGKNLRPFLGHPVIHYPVKAALDSGCFDEVMVSTDDDQIAAAARAAGAVTPFRRSAENASDQATTTDALLEVIAQYRAAGCEFEFICGMYASAPLITVDHLRAGWEIIKDNPAAQTVMPVIRYGYPVHRAFVIQQGRLQLMMPEHGFTRSQDLPVAYHDAGQWYWMRVADFERGRKVFADRCLPVELSELEVQDIDNEVDWKLAELKARIQRGLL
ncbi:MAG TPA: pseudaminic acid cytidylyltransferase [Verrucomicrobiales bacterium]|nr:pseudaminic acid cytidylyltransferase [Verrucomicrobiales bacterium]HRJ11278.1 pseudaminic acid cytidylyltransferase [Prosthecobacter sp.]HRK12973.1 pseudaminic acid cytidylyltransferase [Prosthecobacter sp.]